MAVLDLVTGGDDNLLRDRVLGELIQLFFVRKVSPEVPLVRLRGVAIIVNDTLVEDRRRNALLQLSKTLNLSSDDCLEVLVERTTALGRHGNAQRPDASKQET